MKTRIHFEVLNLSKMVLNYRKNFVKSCTINFIMQTAVMGTENRSGLRFVFNLQIKIDMMSEVRLLVLTTGEANDGVLGQES